MAELVDALRSGRSELMLVEVQVLFRPPLLVLYYPKVEYFCAIVSS